jgi:prefoldin subunit 2
VIASIEQLEPTRKCFRLVGGVLVERTAAEVLPAVTRNREGISKVLEQLQSTFAKREKELTDWITKYKIRIRTQGEDEQPQPQQEQQLSSRGAGVLI